MVVEMWVDGSSSFKDNKWWGGCGVILTYGNHTKEISMGYEDYTNNMCEINAIILGLQSLKFSCKVKVMSDSQYTLDCVGKWIFSWQKNGWKTSKGEDVKNKHLIVKLYQLLHKHDVELVKVKAHVGIPLNERADLLAKEAMRSIRDFNTGGKK